MRDPVLGNWTDPVIVVGFNITNLLYVKRYFKCMEVELFDITHDDLKNKFWHLHFWKNYIQLLIIITKLFLYK